jgi:hypothetical protein
MSNDRILNELESIWTEAAMAQFKELSWHLPGDTEENYKKIQSA